jgi:hypothetical protein
MGALSAGAISVAQDIADYLHVEVNPNLDVRDLLAQEGWRAAHEAVVARAFVRFRRVREWAYRAEIIEDDHSPRAMVEAFTAEALVSGALLHVHGKPPHERESTVLLTTSPHQIAEWRADYPLVRPLAFRRVLADLSTKHFLVPIALNQVGETSLRRAARVSTRLARDNTYQAATANTA